VLFFFATSPNCLPFPHCLPSPHRLPSLHHHPSPLYLFSPHCSPSLISLSHVNIRSSLSHLHDCQHIPINLEFNLLRVKPKPINTIPILVV